MDPAHARADMDHRTIFKFLPLLFVGCGSSDVPKPVDSEMALSGATRVEDTSPAITYVGPWSNSWYTGKNALFSGGSHSTHMDAGARATFTFSGSALAWIGLKDP
jgi:hypothetical protein